MLSRFIKNDKDEDETLPILLNDELSLEFKELSTGEVFSSDTLSPTIQSVNHNFCRICLESGRENEDLISPCNCSGSLAQIHKPCLEKWLSESNTAKCEICHLLIPRVDCFQHSKMNTGPLLFSFRLIPDMTHLLFVTPIALFTLSLCFLGLYYRKFSANGENISLIILSIFLISIYIICCSIMFRYHKHEWKTWRESHAKVLLILPDGQ